MFVIQVDFKDGVSQVESIFIKRLFIRIGTSESSHLVLDGIAKLDFELVIYRGLGSQFKCKSFRKQDSEVKIYPWEKDYQGIGEIDLGFVSLTIVCVPARIAENATSHGDQKRLLIELQDSIRAKGGIFPALYSLTDPTVALSIAGVKRLSIGNSRECLFRSEKFKEKQEKAQIVKLDSNEYSISGIGTRETIRIDGQPIQQSSVLKAKDKISFSSGLELIFLANEKDISDLSEELPAIFFSSGVKSKRSIRAINGPVNPSILPIKVGQTISIGRDASHNIWIDAAFISRLHCTIYVEQDGYVVTDFSTNGLSVNGQRLGKGKQEFFPLGTSELSFGHGARLLLSELDDRGFQDFLSGKDISSNGESSAINNLEEKEEVVLKPESTDYLEQGDTLHEDGLRHKTSFEDFQKRSIRLLDESGGQFLSESVVNYDDKDLQEFPLRVGISKFMPQILIGILVFIILVFFVILALNLVR